MTLASKFPLDKEEPINNDVSNTKFEKEENKERESEGKKVNDWDSIKVDETKGCNLRAEGKEDHVDERKSNAKKSKKEKEELMERKRQYWDSLRKVYTKNFQSEEYMDSVDWEGVRVAKPSKVAETIAARGQHNIIGGRIQVSNYFLINKYLIYFLINKY